MNPRDLVILGLAALLSWSAPAHAQDDFEEEEEDFFAPTDDETSEEEETDAPPAEEEPPPDDDIDFEDEVDEEGNVVEEDLFEDDVDETLLPGTDTPRIYRAREAEIAPLPADEAVMGWEAYLEEYPNSVFRDTIEARLDELQRSQYTDRIRTGDEVADAKDEELAFVLPIHMTNVNPRTHVTAMFEYGFPNYQGGLFDFEYAVLRSVSVHGGFTGRPAGWGLEVGARWAFVKSTKAQLVATLIGDVRLNLSSSRIWVPPSERSGGDATRDTLLFQARPQIAFGKMFGNIAQLLVSFGAEIGTRPYENVALIGGLHAHVRVAEPVGIFLETDFRVENFDRTGPPFAFQVVTLGLKFYPKLKKREGDPLELAAGGSLPAVSQYLGTYAGSVAVQGAYFLDMPYAGAKKRRKK